MNRNDSFAALRVLRGGSWYGNARYCRSADRYRLPPDYRHDNLGFRPARVQVSQAAAKGETMSTDNKAGAKRVRRGGSWVSEARRCRSAYRHGDYPDLRDNRLGFRPARVQARAAGIQPVNSGIAAQAEPADYRDKKCSKLIDQEKEMKLELSDLEWASKFGQDQFGFWAEIEVNDVIQRLRYINPGEFSMGSPESEVGRYDDEGPQRVVKMDGYWLFDTSVTQALWQAVMGSNPSYFKGPELPVENVSWDDCNEFIAKINSMVPGLNLCLPSEEQWEYACRAGTTTPFSFGENISPEQVNYDGNSPYAEGENGLYRKCTVDVKSFSPNSWGLYNMHGNVWEWCADEYRPYISGISEDT